MAKTVLTDNKEISLAITQIINSIVMFHNFKTSHISQSIGNQTQPTDPKAIAQLINVKRTINIANMLELV